MLPRSGGSETRQHLGAGFQPAHGLLWWLPRVADPATDAGGLKTRQNVGVSVVARVGASCMKMPLGGNPACGKSGNRDSRTKKKWPGGVTFGPLGRLKSREDENRELPERRAAVEERTLQARPPHHSQ